MVSGIRYVDRSISIQSESGGIFQGSTSAATFKIRSRTGHRRYHSIEVHFADAVVIGICDVKVAHGVHGDATGCRRKRITSIRINVPAKTITNVHKIERGIDGWASVPREALLSITGYRRNDSVRADLANALVSPVGDVDIAVRIDGNAAWGIEHGFTGRTSVASKSALTITSHSRDDVSLGNE